MTRHRWMLLGVALVFMAVIAGLGWLVGLYSADEPSDIGAAGTVAIIFLIVAFVGRKHRGGAR